MKIINDLHLAAKRQAGATPQSRITLENYQFEGLYKLLQTDQDLMVLGDLFDTSKVSFEIIWKTFKFFELFLQEPNKKLLLVKGNHDAHNRNDEMCALDLLVNMLQESHTERVVYITEPYNLNPTTRVIPHLLNQDLFDLAIDRADKDGIDTLLLHANYNNFFATDSDHSLNLSAEQGDKFDQLIFAHEHTPRNISNAHILGCQYPTSVADCKDTDGFCYTIYDLESGVLSRKPTFNINELYQEINWKELGKTEAKFIRVTGDATVEEAGDAVRAISSFRKGSDAFVITNAVKIEGMVSDEEITSVTGKLASLDTTQILYDLLKDWQVKAIKSIVAGEPVKLREVA